MLDFGIDVLTFTFLSSSIIISFLLKFSLLFGGGILVLLVLGHQIIHVALGLGELHLIHTFSGVPMQEGLTTEHGYALEQLLNGCAVANEGDGHLEASWWNVTDGGLHIVGDPFHEVAAVLVLDVDHLLVDLLHGHAAAEHGGDGQIAAVTWVARSHHVLCIEHLLGELGDGEGAVLLAASAGQGGKAGHEEVQTGERHHVDGKFAQISVELAGETKAGGDPAHCGGHQVVKVTVGGGGKFQSAEADVIQSFIVNTISFICVLDELYVTLGEGTTLKVFMIRSGYSSRILLMSRVPIPDPVPPPRECVSWKPCRQSQLSASLRTTSRTESTNSAPSVYLIPPTKHKIVWLEDLPKGSRPHGVHGARLQVHKNGTSGLIVVDTDPVQLQVTVSVVSPGGIDAVFIADHFPELHTQKERQYQKNPQLLRRKQKPVETQEPRYTVISMRWKLKFDSDDQIDVRLRGTGRSRPKTGSEVPDNAFIMLESIQRQGPDSGRGLTTRLSGDWLKEQPHSPDEEGRCCRSGWGNEMQRFTRIYQLVSRNPVTCE
ncbi:hypothetical protein F7725_017989 [Dissostichus mawsoni]|uniref:Uncharacterized protein n=1 Tax=Dissostichus mawsoni TaxID=36200 RepID=A0A7J5XQD5_DISMA|nr:hypothetical protein F7725_017989 [Dissostichus mawsoni]